MTLGQMGMPHPSLEGMLTAIDTPVLPGSLSEQWNVCGTSGCRCKALQHPKKHGPYHQLSFTVGCKSSTLFIKKEDLAEVRRRITRYHQFKALTTDWVHACIALARTQGFRSPL